ncbi:hypothetical protein [Methylobacterium sp. Gmos1]
MTENTSGQDSRQGKPGKPVLYVLIASFGLALVSFVALLTWQGANAPTDVSQTASRQQGTGSASGPSNAATSATSTGVPAGNPAYPQPASRSGNL